jgi:alpha/beta superfamily hydrolase
MSTCVTVTFSNAQGIQLSALIDTPQSLTEPGHAIVLIHGLGGTKTSHVVTTMAHALTNQGFECLRLDLRGNGDSQGTWEYTPYLSHCDDDVLAAVQYLRDQRNRTVTAVIGHSMGGNIVMMFASKYYGLVPVIVNVSGRYFMNHGNSKHFSPEQINQLEQAGSFVWRTDKFNGKDLIVTADAVKRRAELDMEEYMSELIQKAKAATEDESKECSKTKILTIHGEKDDVIDVNDGRAYHQKLESAKIAGLHELVIVEGADHFYKTPEEHQPLCQAACSFLEHFLNTSKV